MLMLTHTYLLQSYLGEKYPKDYDLDIYVYNIAPDLLTIDPQISPRQTHSIKRTFEISHEFPKASYVMFHLLLDDLSHYGYICQNCHEEFNPDSKGYTYIKGKPLINPLLQLHKRINKKISYNEAAYRSHLIIEMLYDLAIINQINTFNTIELLANAITYTAKNKMSEFARTMKWIYKLEEKNVSKVLKEASFYITKERMNQIMNLDGRINLYTNKFDTKNGDRTAYNEMKDIFTKAQSLLSDDDIFLRQSAKTIKEYGWLPPAR